MPNPPGHNGGHEPRKGYPLLKGSKGKVRPITVGTTLKRIALTVILKAETNVKEIVGGAEFAIGRKSAIEDLKRDIDAAIAKVREDHGSAIVFQLDCSCAFNRTPRQAALRSLEAGFPTS